MVSPDFFIEVKRQLVEVHGCVPRPDNPQVPLDVPDGEYEIIYQGKTVTVRIENNYLCFE